MSFNPIRDTVIANATEKIAKIIERVERKEDRASVLMRIAELFCDTCGGRCDDKALELPRYQRCDCVLWSDE